MKKILTAAVAAVIATSSLGVASAAEAQSRNYEQRYDHRDERRDDRYDRREYRQEMREERREYRQERRAQQRAYARWQRAEQRYNAGRYYAPRGYQTRSWSYGQYMPSYYRSNAYVIRDYNRYGLRQPAYGQHYVRSGNDVVLAAISGGLISAVISGLFY